VTEERTFRDTTVRLVDLADDADLVTGCTFDGCTLVGPAVVVLVGEGSITGCTLKGDHAGLFWPLGPDRDHVIGAIGLRDCTLTNCTLQRIGIAYPPSQEALIRDGFG
jgi:hypothetical protein